MNRRPFPGRLARSGVLLLAALNAAGAAQATDSLYKESTFQALTSDRKGSRVGDLVTVQILETSSATSSADTQADRNAAVSLDVGTTSRRHRATIGVGNEMEGRGRTERTGHLLAQVTVSVQEVLPNGDLRLAGEQVIEINDERQQIRLEGRIRPQDLQENNTVLSWRLADTRISYVGEGVVGERQKPGWWQRLLTALGL
jgi:flagellar L-ring protein precursor FlgH